MTPSRIQGRLAAVFQNRVVQHTLFWLFSFYVLLRMFAYQDEFEKVNIIYTFLFHLSLIFVVYLNLLWLIPRYLKPGRYFTYGFLALGLVLAGSLLNRVTFNSLADQIFPGYYFISYYRFGEILQFVLAYFCITMLLKLSKGWFQIKEQEKKIHRLEREKLNSELRVLKSQLNPHFLFNSLNNLYSLTLEEDPRTPEAILQLSENLRYVLYDAEAAVVDLSQEVDFIRNYVALQTLRAPEAADIQLSAEVPSGQGKVAPLIFLPFIENAFKHGLKGAVDEAYVHIFLKTENGRLFFRTENNSGRSAEDLPAEEGGVGIANARRRLQLLYPGQHKLDISPSAHAFIVTLELPLL